LRQNLVLIEVGKVAASVDVFSIVQAIDLGPSSIRNEFSPKEDGAVVAVEGLKKDDFFFTVAIEIREFGTLVPLLGSRKR
jgi:hypothetical protein